MIKMIKSTYGLKVDGGVKAMTKRSGPFKLSKTREAELVELGVAEYVEEPTQEKTYEDMKMTELREVAAARGVDVSAAKSKSEIIALLEAAEVTGEEVSGES